MKGREHLARHYVQRRRPDIRRYLDEETPFPKDRLSKEVPYALTTGYRALFDKVLDYARESVRDADDGSVRQRVRWWSALALLRALASSPRAAAATLRTRASGGEVASLEEADALGRAVVLDTADDEALESADATPGADPESIDGDTVLRRRLHGLARDAAALEGKGDTKLATLTSAVKALLADGYDPIVFCRFIDTAEYVAEKLQLALKGTATVAAVTGQLPPTERGARIAELAAEPGRHVLIATDCLSEGVNVQQNFQAVVHYDLAWNPTRHEQREGRVDRFGQVREEVRTITIYGRDNSIDGIVLTVLLRKHNAIRKATGISVPVPDGNDGVVQAVLEGLLLRQRDPEQLTLDLGVSQKRDELYAEWESAAERERLAQTKYAQAGIHPEEVSRELAEVRRALGTTTEITHFTREALRALRSTLTLAGDGFTASTSVLPLGLRDTLPPGSSDPLPFHARPPAPRGEAVLARTDPAVEALARYVLDAALDPALAAPLRPARRCGVVRTADVKMRTTLLLVRYRFHLTLPSRSGANTAVAEEARVLGFAGPTSDPVWLPEDESLALLSAAPAGNVPLEQAESFAQRALAGVTDLLFSVDARGDELAETLRASHARVREVAGEIKRGLSVTAQHPADVLGLYVYLPVAGTS